ncbi:MAG: VWA domain-containing protein [Gallionella sp.]
MTAESILHAFHFLRPYYLLALPVLGGLAFWLARRNHPDRDWLQLIDAQLLPELRLDTGSTRSMRPWPLLALLWSIAAIALAGPSWQKNPTAAYRSSAAWVFVLDLSPSMADTDITPDRATRARYALDDLLSAAHDARVALVVFSEQPYTVTPLTKDVATVRALLPPLSPDIMPSPGNQLSPALVMSSQLLKNSGAKDQHIVILTDGFNDPATAMKQASQLKAHNITLSVVGVGTTTGSPQRDAKGQFVKNAKGRTQLDRLDVNQLQQLAGASNYTDIGKLASLVHQLQSSPIQLDKETSVLGGQVYNWQDAGVYLLPLLLLAALFARRRWL